ncbi:DUF4097 family beta strand repeat-containing protein [Amycolatopsis sp. 195334CR]|uniref:DUF4097 family beta strand repeat-containing protein n=1 Tax=Amycolatopsis sp. 195334CR TaxID=2814588 RepID=UPI001A90A8B0|nr:DUF4097 family beta strand repeat-containing protein [Amycolatopsis sp. 195334CR]MBN6037897.1 DUF4097 family beta strand repeat protein [Amycolatopsis sp. 195334CR]
MSTGDTTGQPDDHLVRTGNFPATGPIELDVSITVGRVQVLLAESDGEAETTVELRHEPAAQAPWADGVNAVLSWVTERFGDQFDTDVLGSPAEAVRQSRIEQVGDQIIVRGPKALPLRKVPLNVTVHAPRGSHLGIRAGAADVTVTGTAGRASISTGSGDVSLGETKAAANVRTGSGEVQLGPSTYGLQVRSGSGSVRLAAPTGSATVVTGTGDIWLGAVSGDVMARSGSGDLTVAEAKSGSMELNTGSGEIRFGVASGVTAEVDVSTVSGRVSSELPVRETPPEEAAAVRARMRTGSGDAVVTSAGA